MTSFSSILQDIQQLPPDAQKQIFDFVDTMKEYYNKNIVSEQSNTLKFRQFGQFRGKLEIADDFDDELPSEFWTGEHP